MEGERGERNENKRISKRERGRKRAERTRTGKKNTRGTSFRGRDVGREETEEKREERREEKRR